MELTGRLIERPTDRLWQPSVRGRRVRVASEPLTLTVAPRPAAYGGDEWLPARALELSESFSDATTIRVGEPVTRTVIDPDCPAGQPGVPPVGGLPAG